MKTLTSYLSGQYKRLEDRAMASLSEDERREARALDEAYKANKVKIWAFFVAVVATLGIALHLVAPKIGPLEAVSLSLIFVVAITFGLYSVWAGARRKPKWNLAGGRLVLFIIAMAVIGGVAGNLFGRVLRHGWAGAIENILPAAGVVVGSTLVFGVIYALAVLFVSQVRRKQIALENEKLQALAQKESLARHLTDSRLKLLQAQVEPHFLFNTLASIQELAEDKSPAAAALTAELITFLRSGLTGLRDETTTLAKEFAMIEAYLNIMKARVADRLHFTLTLPDALGATSVPPAMLITLVENAIKHGIEKSVSGGEVTVIASATDTELVLSVRDTGAGLVEASAPIAGHGFGLHNVATRLHALFGEAASLSVTSVVPQGCLSVLRLPLGSPSAAPNAKEA